MRRAITCLRVVISGSAAHNHAGCNHGYIVPGIPEPEPRCEAAWCETGQQDQRGSEVQGLRLAPSKPPTLTI